MTGGGMRQAGLLAAAAQHALDHHVQRLAIDHEHAKLLAQGLSGLPGVAVQAPQTNIVFIDLSADLVQRHPNGVASALAARGLLCTGAARLRLVTHLDIDATQIQRAVEVLRQVLG
jgi:threonine aldolase